MRGKGVRMTVEKLVHWIWRREIVDNLISKHESDLTKIFRFAVNLPLVSPPWRSQMSERRHGPCACATEQSLYHTDSQKWRNAQGYKQVTYDSS